ncbi:MULTISPECIES: UDP-glucose dehydrogenase family protein [unclassified Paenibacillus]|uniref:UDP-glucose dehydrogenase family protein n=1 Tax=unclassified Paenibacillus TaxID=185978 RepID=UPI0009A55C36|nr:MULTISPECIES: nucleotide sugar dehydrogenase [unclassified Paenibacillus]SLK20841.1 UDPglucose 6-dehydrogenase [Paenibacillus sp. RU5A]SOC76327.1 UDPglucose 6-dehydrogenase [Paenibacillus sp. RU26A]SOC77955.1 UDPglucose 6-dehydrogenase [Paenibacillus sp. RU5M]
MIYIKPPVIAVIGLGFVGLAAALGFAEKDYTVYAFDIDVSKRNSLQLGEIPFHEPDMEEALSTHMNQGFTLCESMEEAISEADLIFICVGTPYQEGGLDLSSLVSAIHDISRLMNVDQFKGIIVKSTIPPGTIRGIIKPLLESVGFKIGRDVGLAYNPEFLREGSAWEDFLKPDRIIIGEVDSRTAGLLEKVYLHFESPCIRVSPETSEYLKYASNALLATLISFANEQAMIAEKIGDVDIPQMFNLLHMDKRWSGFPAGMSHYVYPGCGFGGYCLPKDTLGLKYTASKYGHNAKMLEAVMKVNQDIADFTVEQIIRFLKHRDEQIGILGLSFKPGSDDVRNSPAARIIELLLDEGCTNLTAYDPVAMSPFREHYDFPIRMMNSLSEITVSSDICVIVTAWPEFQTLTHNSSAIRIVDARYLLNSNKAYSKEALQSEEWTTR